jgi:hypothetical protein
MLDLVGALLGKHLSNQKICSGRKVFKFARKKKQESSVPEVDVY